MNFKQLDLIQPILTALEEVGYTTPTEIQAKAIPPILQRKDVLGCAQTGTGKTAAFAIPILHQLEGRPKNAPIHSLIVTPTRELAIQIKDNFKLYSKHMPVKCVAIFGGVPQTKQVNAIRNGVDVLIATPGRLLDLVNQGIVKISKIEVLVLDEADQMLDMGFIHDIKKILTKVPAKRQTLFFSATMPKTIKSLANSILNQPVEVAVTPVSSTAEKVEQSVYFVEKKEKPALLTEVLIERNVDRSLVFARTKYGADKLVKFLAKKGLKAAAIHGNKSQNARQRALEDFKVAKVNVLVATDIAARGIDISGLPLVVNYELPTVAETYVHRIGRTGRAGMEGVAVSFCDAEEKKSLLAIEKLIGLKLTVKN